MKAEIRAEEAAIGRAADPLRVFIDVVVFLDDDRGAAAARKALLDDLDGHVYRSDAYVFTGTPAELADHLEDWRTEGVAGFRLRPGVLSHDLEAITRKLVPVLQDRGRFRRGYEEATLRARLGLRRPVNRYAMP